MGDVFDYDNNDQVTVVKLNIANPDTTAPGSQTIHYDTNGNRTSFAPYGTTDNYTTNNLNEYTVRNSASAAYNASADMTTGFDGSTYTYDAQDRLLSATESGVTETFDYDGLNRQVSRTLGGVTTYNVYDGWALIEEYQSGGIAAAYLHGAGGLVKDLTTNNYYYQDASGSTSHLADSAGNLLEWYRYDLQGTPVFYNFANTQQSASAYSIRHLFTGQQWYAELGLYDLRNRFYSPDIGRFLQPDPIGFWGDRSNLYRYCRNNPLTRFDPTGTKIIRKAELGDDVLDQDNYDGNYDYSGSDNYTDGDIPSGEYTGFGPTGEYTSLGPNGGYTTLANGSVSFEYHMNGSGSSPTSNVGGNSTASSGGTDIGSVGDIFGGIKLSLDIGGIAAGGGENLLSGGGDYWLSNRGYYRPNFHGNESVRGYRLATRGSRVLRGAGIGFFGVQVGTAFFDLYHNPSSSNFQYQGLRLGVGLVGFAGIPGFVAATTYFVIDETIGWDALTDKMKSPTPLIITPDWGF